MADRYLLESGSPDGYLLEDGTGVLLLEVEVVEVQFRPPTHQQAKAKRPQVIATQQVNLLTSTLSAAAAAVFVRLVGDNFRLAGGGGLVG